MRTSGASTRRSIGLRSAAALGLALVVSGFALTAASPRFYPDDPIWRDPESQNAAGVKPIDLSDRYDALENSFLGAGERADRRAANVNTLDEVPDSTWFTNRVGRRRLSPAEAAKGPDTGTGPASGPWTITGGKTEGVQPGLTIRDSAGQIYFVKFDPPSNPEMASGAEVISTKFFHAAGYHVPENYLATIRPDALVIGDGAEVVEDGKRRAMRKWDVEAVLAKSARKADGSYRVLASKALTGRPIGPFRYYGTRPDDPNDIFPHEHRRELRGVAVLSAWLNHDDSRAPNTLDTLVPLDGRTVVRHHLIDFGSTLGSGSTRSQSTQAGNEFLWESRPTIITMLTLGFYVRPWLKVEYPDLPSVGRFESSYFQPEAWKPIYANPAFANARPDDRFWAARLVAGISEDTVRAIVGTARFSDPRATEYMTDTILARRRKVLAGWLAGPNPTVDPVLDASGQLTVGNAAEHAGVGPAAQGYTVEWAAFDNASGAHQSAVSERATGPTMRAPAALLAARHEFLSAKVGAIHPDHPSWATPVTFFFRRQASGWQLVGVER
ncbi:MAG TPA: hypothetical protein VM032_06700 [Vicinamibacterales bacterium]|nr:hypothetical protein [Vicinamibacterales bacterium]